MTYDATKNRELWWFEPQGNNSNPPQWIDPDDEDALRKLEIDPTEGEFKATWPQTAYFGSDQSQPLFGSGLFRIADFHNANRQEIQKLTGGDFIQLSKGEYLQVDLSTAKLRTLVREHRLTYIHSCFWMSSLNMARTWALQTTAQLAFEPPYCKVYDNIALAGPSLVTSDLSQTSVGVGGRVYDESDDQGFGQTGIDADHALFGSEDFSFKWDAAKTQVFIFLKPDRVFPRTSGDAVRFALAFPQGFRDLGSSHRKSGAFRLEAERSRNAVTWIMP